MWQTISNYMYNNSKREYSYQNIKAKKGCSVIKYIKNKNIYLLWWSILTPQFLNDKQPPLP